MKHTSDCHLRQKHDDRSFCLSSMEHGCTCKGAKPFIWLQSGESFGEAKCGCRLENGESPCLWLCKMHQAASELLAACRFVVAAIPEGIGTDTDAAMKRVCEQALTHAEGR